MNIKEIEKHLKETPILQLQEVLALYAQDERKGVQKLLTTHQKKWDQLQKEQDEWLMRCTFDEVLGDSKRVVGIDEVGRGPLAGPVVAAAVILPPDVMILGLKDSKKLTSEKRSMLFQEIKEKAIAIGVGIVEAPRIDEINILQATFEAMREALSKVEASYECILVDGDKVIPRVDKSQQAIIGGDNKSASIAAASVIAKVIRDDMMVEYAKEYPGYEWESNKGYGSSSHYAGIRLQGITPLHRKSFLKNEGIV